MNQISADIIDDLRKRLADHPVYDAVSTREDLQIFMRHHVFSVWDFMSLIKYLQSIIAPTTWPWTPEGDASVRRFINELVMEEESDVTGPDGEISSHFELYLRAMHEIGASTAIIESFVAQMTDGDIDLALQMDGIPEPSRDFTTTTFGFIRSGKPHEVAAALALGREHIIPLIFRAILERIGVDERQAPLFHFYLNRHIHLDEDFHAPLSIRLLNGLCAGDSMKLEEAMNAAERAVDARLAFWDGVYEELSTQ